ncbi:MAG: hypothetical protein ACE5JC_00490, partial [Candidatus Zixiibacteriota bacterium]
REGPASLAEPLSTKIPFSAALRAWNLRPDAHVGAKEKGRFLVGTVSSSRADRAEAAGLNPGETVFVRLFLGTRPEGRYINALASGDSADFFERAEKNSTAVDAEIRVAASYHEEALDSRIPIFVVDSVQAATNDG